MGWAEISFADIRIQQALHQEVLPQKYPEIQLVCKHTPSLSPLVFIGSLVLAYLRDLTHSFALCDRHMIRIVGKWYRCAFCAKDLCAECEALDSHDNTHVFLVFKAPVDMQAFRCAFPCSCHTIPSLMHSFSQQTFRRFAKPSWY